MVTQRRVKKVVFGGRAVQELCRSCVGAVRELSRICEGAVQEGAVQELLYELCRICVGAVQEVCCFRRRAGVSRTAADVFFPNVSCSVYVRGRFVLCFSFCFCFENSVARTGTVVRDFLKLIIQQGCWMDE